ncbi:hypothetical protein [Halorussus pelagicus]|uniref:hypothetical protein n=1 Tax=Halorussus pelagicus TaxID=2505977 RepID=UPI000FFC012D|nr:hypothetical protein [Halorussus pelagicus]
MKLLSMVNLALFVSGASLTALVFSLRAEGSLKLEEEIAYPLVFIGLIPFSVANNPRCVTDCATPFETFAFQVAANLCFLLAFALQLRANAKKSSSNGPTHPKNEPYEGGGQNYPWEDD